MTAPVKKTASVLTTGEMEGIRNVDRLLPSQEVMRKHFTGGPEAFYPQLEALLHAVLPVKSVEEKWDIALKPGVTYASLGSDLGRLYFYQLLIRTGGYRNILELGSFIGVSALFLAEAAGKEGQVTSVEIGREFYDLAVTNIARNGYADRIELIHADAVALLPDLAKAGKRYDMILMDAAKGDYAAMLTDVLDCLAPGGLLLVDDIFLNGDTLNDTPVLEQGRSVKKLIGELPRMKGVALPVILPMGNGLLMCHKER